MFRYGGDEFVVILPRSDAEDLSTIAEPHRAVRSPPSAAPGTAWASDGVSIAASIGTASFPVDGDTPEGVLLAADRACFVAKRRGRGRVATASEGRELASEFELSEPTPVDPPSVTA